jgi:predicted nucleic acid-binding protein
LRARRLYGTPLAADRLLTMRHVFVETNWVFACAAPAHHREVQAVELLDRARAGELQLHLPSPCLTEARQAIAVKCQPRNEADAIRRFLKRASAEQRVSSEDERITREVLDRFDRQVHRELEQFNDIIVALRQETNLHVFGLTERMLDRSIEVAQLDLMLKPFDQAILAAILVRAEELAAEGDADLNFCENDSDLQPWEKRTQKAKQPLARLYDDAGIWVYADFSMQNPPRPFAWT